MASALYSAISYIMGWTPREEPTNPMTQSTLLSEEEFKDVVETEQQTALRAMIMKGKTSCYFDALKPLPFQPCIVSSSYLSFFLYARVEEAKQCIRIYDPAEPDEFKNNNWMPLDDRHIAYYLAKFTCGDESKEAEIQVLISQILAIPHLETHDLEPWERACLEEYKRIQPLVVKGLPEAPTLEVLDFKEKVELKDKKA